MSGVTGEIGYKVGARASQSPLVNSSFTGTLGVSNLSTGNIAITVNGTQTVNGAVLVAPLGTGSAVALSVVGNGIAPAAQFTGFSNSGVGSAFGLEVKSGSQAGFEKGLRVRAGANGSDIAFQVVPLADNGTFCAINGDGSGNLGPALTHGAKWGTGGAYTIDTNQASAGVPLTLNAATGTSCLVAKASNLTLFAVSYQDGAVVLGTSTAYAWGTGTTYPMIQFAGIGGIMGTATMGLVKMGGGLYYNGTNYIYGQAGTGIINSLGTGSFTVGCVSTAGTAGGTAMVTTVFSIGGTVTSNSIQGYGPQAAALVDMTPDSGSFTLTLTGCSANPSCTGLWRKQGNLVSILIAGTQGTSNANSLTFTGLPTAIQPTNQQSLPCALVDQGNNVAGLASVTSTGTVTLLIGGVSGTSIVYSGAGFAGTGQKGFNHTVIGPYQLT